MALLWFRDVSKAFRGWALEEVRQFRELSLMVFAGF